MRLAPSPLAGLWVRHVVRAHRDRGRWRPAQMGNSCRLSGSKGRNAQKRSVPNCRQHVQWQAASCVDDQAVQCRVIGCYGAGTVRHTTTGSVLPIMPHPTTLQLDQHTLFFQTGKGTIDLVLKLKRRCWHRQHIRLITQSRGNTEIASG